MVLGFLITVIGLWLAYFGGHAIVGFVLIAVGLVLISIACDVHTMVIKMARLM